MKRWLNYKVLIDRHQRMSASLYGKETQIGCFAKLGEYLIWKISLEENNMNFINVSECCRGFYSLEEIINQLQEHYNQFSVEAMNYESKICLQGQRDMLLKIIQYLQKIKGE